MKGVIVVFALTSMLIGVVTAIVANSLGFNMRETPVQYWSVFALGMICYLVGKAQS